MCFKIDANELETVKGLMTMTVYSVISDILNVELEDIKPHSFLVKDLHMTDKTEKALRQSFMEMFDDLVVDLTSNSSVQTVVDQIIQDEFEELAEFDYLDMERVH
ncbi:MAG: hypothetical protein AB8D52_00225 [Gammaproteobacteria bacterium]